MDSEDGWASGQLPRRSFLYAVATGVATGLTLNVEGAKAQSAPKQLIRADVFFLIRGADKSKYPTLSCTETDQTVELKTTLGDVAILTGAVPTERLRITSDGKVNVKGSLTVSGGLKIGQGASAKEVIDSSGKWTGQPISKSWLDGADQVTTTLRVGVGTIKPKEPLQIGDTIAFHDGGDKALAFNGYYVDPVGWKRLQAGSVGLVYWSTQGGALSFKTAASDNADTVAAELSVDRLIIANNGNVGIGTAQTDYALQIGDASKSVALVLRGPDANTASTTLAFEDDGGSQARWFRIIYNTDKNKLKITSVEHDSITVFGRQDGNVGIGTEDALFRLDVRGDTGWIGSGDNSQAIGGWRLGRWTENSPNTWVYLSRSDIPATYQDLAVGALWAGGDNRFGTADDLAEMTPVQEADGLEPGDVVVIADPQDDRVLLGKSRKPYDAKVAGIVSDPETAALIIGGSHPTDVHHNGSKPIALAGRVLTRVCAENGSILPGDLLTTSSQPGHAMKATKAGWVVGKALQSFNGSQSGERTGKIWVLVTLNWCSGDPT